MPTYTSVTCLVQDDNGKPVAGATVTTNVGGVDVAFNNNKTDAQGKVVFKWANDYIKGDLTQIPPPSDTYSAIVRANKGKKGRDESTFLFKKNQHHEILLVLDLTPVAPADPMDRYLQRSVYPVKNRSEKYLLNDIAWGFLLLEGGLETASLDLKLLGFDNLKNIDESIARAKDAWRSAEQASTLKELFEKAKFGNAKTHFKSVADHVSSLGAVGYVSAGVDIVSGIYDVADAIRKDDPDGVKNALCLTAMDLILGLHPATAPFWWALKFGFGLGSILALHAPRLIKISDTTIDAINFTSLMKSELKDFREAIYASPDKWRIDISTAPPYKRKAASGPGLAFERGGLVFVDVKGTTHRVRIGNAQDAIQFLYVVKELRGKI